LLTWPNRRIRDLEDRRKETTLEHGLNELRSVIWNQKLEIRQLEELVHQMVSKEKVSQASREPPISSKPRYELASDRLHASEI
jgi:uncharacterized coiled-coil protein SlyX